MSHLSCDVSEGDCCIRAIFEEVNKTSLNKYSEISIAFELIHPKQTDLKYNEVSVPTIKDYDAYENPSCWADHFDTSNWMIIHAYFEDTKVGSAVIVHKTNECNMLENRTDLAVLWDIRVHPKYRNMYKEKGYSIGKFLLSQAELYAHMKWNCNEMKIETQDNNIQACKFYSRNGYTIKYSNPNIYEEFPDEIQLLYYKLL